jgi:hypothetical protein
MMTTKAAAWLHENGMPAGEASNVAKYAAAEAALAAVGHAIHRRRSCHPVVRRQRAQHRIRLGSPVGTGQSAADRAGEPRNDPQLCRPAQLAATPGVLTGAST